MSKRVISLINKQKLTIDDLFLVPMELESEDEDKDNLEGDKDELERSHIMEELWLEGVQLPPEPTGQCSAELQVTILIF